VQGASGDGFEAGRSAGVGSAQARIPIAGEGHDLRRGLAGKLPRAGDDIEASLISDDSGCMVPLVGDELRAFLVRAVKELTEWILTAEAAPTGTPEPPDDELAPCWTASHREAVTMSEPTDRLDDTLHNTAGISECLPIMLTIGERSQRLTEAYVDGGAGLLHLRARVRR
jgi:hypothetical protein